MMLEAHPPRDVQEMWQSELLSGAPPEGNQPLASVRHVVVDRANSRDVDGIYGLTSAMTSKGLLLSRELTKIRSMIPSFYVARSPTKGIVGCGAITELSRGLGEINALAIRDGYQGRGFGSRLVRALILEGVRRGLREILAITYQTGFFKTLGFSNAEPTRFIEKIRREALECPDLGFCPEPALHITVNRQVTGLGAPAYLLE